MTTSFSRGRSRSTWREPPTMDKHLVSFITRCCESSAPFCCNIQSRARTHAVLVIGLYELLGNPTTQLIEPHGPFLWTGCPVNKLYITWLNWVPMDWISCFQTMNQLNKRGHLGMGSHVYKQ